MHSPKDKNRSYKLTHLFNVDCCIKRQYFDTGPTLISFPLSPPSPLSPHSYNIPYDNMINSKYRYRKILEVRKMNNCNFQFELICVESKDLNIRLTTIFRPGVSNDE